MERQRRRDETTAVHEENGKTDVQQTKKEVQLMNQAAISPPPSSTSSPSHDQFSFTISLHPSNNTKSPPPPPPFSATIDLSPADEIFFHGHLLPLHLLSHHHHHPISASSSHSSTNSLDSITFTLKDELLHDHENNNNNINNDDDDLLQENSHVLEGKVRGKSRSFSHLFPKWRKYHSSHHDHHHHHHQETDHEYDHHDDHKQKIRKSKFDIVKRYMRMVKPFIPFRNKTAHHEFIRHPASSNSHSGSLTVGKKKDLVMRERRSEFSSAPVSIRTSPTNSGLLVASGNLNHTNKNDSTVEELQAAIQAAIAHCKKSNIAEEGQKEQADKTAST